MPDQANPERLFQTQSLGTLSGSNMSISGLIRRPWLRRVLVALSVLLLVSIVGLAVILRVPTVALPEGVHRATTRVELTGQWVMVDAYLPAGTNPAPLVLLAHGFTRNRHTMAGWGALLAREGFIVVVPDLPTLADHARNGRALVELLDLPRQGQLLSQRRTSGQAALVGFSAGGLSSWLAAEGNTNVACWVGLDPVGQGNLGEAAKKSGFSGYVIRAEPVSWNAQGNARGFLAALPGPAFSLIVNHATHVDAENPTSLAAEWACGKSEPARREIFGRYLLLSLRAGLLGDELARQSLRSATNDPGVHEVKRRD